MYSLVVDSVTYKRTVRVLQKLFPVLSARDFQLIYKIVCGILALVLLPGCTCQYYYRENEKEAWIFVEHYYLHANIDNGEQLEIGVRPHGYFQGDVVDTASSIRYIDSSVVFEPYFARRGDLKVVRENGLLEDRSYSLEGVDAWETSTPLHVYMRYQIDSSGVTITREHELTLQKYSNCFFSVH